MDLLKLPDKVKNKTDAAAEVPSRPQAPGSLIPQRWVSREAQAMNEGAGILDIPVPDLVRRLLRARKIVTAEALQDILAPKLAHLKDPFSILGMEKATQRLVQAFAQDQSVCIYADFDLDGTSGLALLYEGLKHLGFRRLSYYQPKRLAEGYGLHPHVVQDLSDQGIHLIVTVDVGITANKAAELAQTLKIDLIITDHHQPGEKLPLAHAVVNPNQAGDQSGLGYLCGAGVAFYLLRAVQRNLLQQNLVSQSQVLDLRVLLDFFTVGTLTDMVPLVGDNRALVRAGLLQLEKTQRPGLRSLLKALQLEGRPLSCQDVAIRFAPKLNALSRLENGLLPVDIFLEQDPKKAEQMVHSVLESNEDRVQLQQQGEQLAQQLLVGWPHQKFVFVSSPEFHRGVIGLIATRLAQNFHCPAFVGAENAEGLIVGSSRLPGTEVGSVLSALKDSESALNRFGGHHSAAGFELHPAKVPQFIENLRSHFDRQRDQDQVIEQEFDFELSQKDITEANMKSLDAIGPFGQGFMVPQFVFRALKIKSIFDLRGGHLKFTFQADEFPGFSRSNGVEALYFSPPSQFVRPSVGDRIDLLGELQWNYFAGRKTVQILIRDLIPTRLDQ